ncbi:MAG: hypothetical protein E6590_17875 [Clostridiales bacterium]|nr:hypothetical protein [Clostridiales bacterium]
MEKKKIKDNGLLAEDVKKIVVYDEHNKKEIAVITKEMITTANEDTVIKISF